MPDDWFDEGGSGNPLDIPALLDSAAVQEALFQMLAAGALLSLGATGDRGALGITITVDGRWRREYFRDTEELVSWLAEALPAVGRACEVASSGRRKRTRSPRGL
jgi:hypothetical protein